MAYVKKTRPFKIFTVVYEQHDKLNLLTVRAHDAEHAKRLATRQIERKTLLRDGFPTWFGVRLVLTGTPKVAT